MADRPRLALAIPTYGRAPLVAENLAAIADEARALGVAVYLSDDSADDATERVARDLAGRLPGLRYRRNSPALRHDANLVSTLSWADADFVWLLGDGLHIRPGVLAQLLTFLADQDLVFLRSRVDDRRMIPTLSNDETLRFVSERLWHQTETGATVFGRRVCDWVRAQGPALIVKRNFPQLSILLGYAAAYSVTLGWFGELATGSGRKHSYWRDQAVSVFVDDWAALVNAFPSVIPPTERAAVIRSHSVNTKLFNGWMLLSLKPTGQFSWASLRRPHFMDAMHLPAWQVVALLATPPQVVKAARQLVRGVRRLLGGGR